MPWEHALRPLLTCLAASLLALAFTAPATAQYKWKDAKGQVHVSDLPPPREVPDKDVLMRPPAAARRALAADAPASAATPDSARASAPGKPPLDPELDARRKKAEAEVQARAQAEEGRMALQRADNCQRARQQIGLLESGQRVVRSNAQGERVVMDDAARAAELNAARQAAASDCR